MYVPAARPAGLNFTRTVPGVAPMPAAVPLTSENGPEGICTASMSMVAWSELNPKLLTWNVASTAAPPTEAEIGTVSVLESDAALNDGLLTRSTWMLTLSGMLGFCTASLALVTVAVPVRRPTVEVTTGTLTVVNEGVSTAVPESVPERTPEPVTT